MERPGMERPVCLAFRVQNSFRDITPRKGEAIGKDIGTKMI